MFFICYMLQCNDGSYYVGTHRGDDVMTRVNEHNMGSNPKAYTCNRRPVELVWSEVYPTPGEMISAERQLKGWSRAKKEALIRGDITTLKALAKSRTSPPIRELGKFYKLTHPEDNEQN